MKSKAIFMWFFSIFLILLPFPSYAEIPGTSKIYSDKDIMNAARGVYEDLKISEGNNSFRKLSGRESAPDSWKIINVFDDRGIGGSGLYACAIDDNNGNCIIAYRGTEAFKDGPAESVNNIAQDMILADAGLANSGETTEQHAAERYTHYIFEEIGDDYKWFTLVGHSLGGNLAEHSAITAPDEMKKKCSAISLDGPGFSEVYLDERKDDIDKLDGKLFRRSWSVVGILLNTLSTEEFKFIDVPSGSHIDYDGPVYDKNDNFTPGSTDFGELYAHVDTTLKDKWLRFVSDLFPIPKWIMNGGKSIVVKLGKDPKKSIWVRAQGSESSADAEKEELKPINTSQVMKYDIETLKKPYRIVRSYTCYHDGTFFPEKVEVQNVIGDVLETVIHQEKMQVDELIVDEEKVNQLDTGDYYYKFELDYSLNTDGTIKEAKSKAVDYTAYSNRCKPATYHYEYSDSGYLIRKKISDGKEDNDHTFALTIDKVGYDFFDESELDNYTTSVFSDHVITWLNNENAERRLYELHTLDQNGRAEAVVGIRMPGLYPSTVQMIEYLPDGRIPQNYDECMTDQEDIKNAYKDMLTLWERYYDKYAAAHAVLSLTSGKDVEEAKKSVLNTIETSGLIQSHHVEMWGESEEARKLKQKTDNVYNEINNTSDIQDYVERILNYTGMASMPTKKRDVSVKKSFSDMTFNDTVLDKPYREVVQCFWNPGARGVEYGEAPDIKIENFQVENIIGEKLRYHWIVDGMFEELFRSNGWTPREKGEYFRKYAYRWQYDKNGLPKSSTKTVIDATEKEEIGLKYDLEYDFQTDGSVLLMGDKEFSSDAISYTIDYILYQNGREL